MKKISQFFITTLLLTYISFVSFSQSIVIKNDSGEEVKLYGKSYALVIGVSNYINGWPTLNGVLKDVADVKQTMEQQGFHVVTVIDPNHEELIKAFRDFINKYGLETENRLIFYFAGHGHTIKASYGEEMGYIIPADAPNPNKDKNDFLAKAMAMQQIEVFAKQIQSKHALFLFDACFSGSIFAISRAMSENISFKTSKPVRQFITSGSAEETVPDESIFKSQFVDGLNGYADLNQDGFITGTELGEFLQDKVINYSKGSQHPQYGKIRNPNLDKGDFVFLAANSGKSIMNIEKSINSDNSSRSVNENDRDNIKPLNAIRKYSVIDESGFNATNEEMSEIFFKVAFQTRNGSFLSAEKGGGEQVSASRKHIDRWESFKIINLENGKVAFKTQNGYYLKIGDDEGSLDATAETLSEKTEFEIIQLEDANVTIRTYENRFLCALSGGGRKIVSALQVKEHEIFKMIPVRLYRIKVSNGMFAVSDKGKISAVCKEPDDALVFEIFKVDRDKLVFRDKSGNYLRITDKGSFTDKKEITEECVFRPEFLSNGFVRLKAMSGKYVTAIGGGGFMFRADKIVPGEWETFELLPSTPDNLD